jgi:hypothetical protein
VAHSVSREPAKDCESLEGEPDGFGARSEIGIRKFADGYFIQRQESNKLSILDFVKKTVQNLLAPMPASLAPDRTHDYCRFRQAALAQGFPQTNPT